MNILFLSHSVPFPPNKGDKIRSFHLIKELSKSHTIFLHAGSTEASTEGLAEGLRPFCAEVSIHRRSPRLSAIFALASILTPFPLSIGYFFSLSMLRGVLRTMKTKRIDAIVAYSSSVAPYAFLSHVKTVAVDLVDADSVKWGEYASVSRFPKRLIYALEYRRLSRWEKSIQERCDFTLVCSDAEKEKLAVMAPTLQDKVLVIKNGIDFDRFPFVAERPRSRNLVFTGQMDYLPNIDAVLYFYLKILPLIKKRISDVTFTIVGRNPDALIRETCQEAIITGEVKNVADFLAPAAVFVAPLRLAYGIQNKVLEAMASGLPVVGTPEVQRGLRAEPGRDLLIADSPEAFAESVIELLEDHEKAALLVRNAYSFVRDNHRWEMNVQAVDGMLRTAAAK